MKHLKMLPLVAMAAMGLTACVGVSAAQADLFTDSAKTIKYET